MSAMASLPGETSDDMMGSVLDTADRVANLTAGLGGRDKLYRTLQYLLRIIITTAEPHYGAKHPTIEKLELLAGAFSRGRRFLRLAALPSALQGWIIGLREPNPLLRSYNIIAKAAGIAFMVLDNIGYFARIGVVQWDTKYWRFWDCLSWAVSMWFSVLYDYYRWCEHEQTMESGMRAAAAATTAEDRAAALATVEAARKKRMVALLNILKNCADLPVALDGIFEFAGVPPALWHWCGLISSLAGLKLKWDVTAATTRHRPPPASLVAPALK